MAKHSNAKLIIELSGKNMSRREIARTRHISAHTIKEVLDRASEKGVGWDDVSLMGDDEIAAMLFPEDKEAEGAVARPDYGYVHDELRKVGVTLKLLWEEYRDECAGKEKIAVSYVTFTRGYADYAISKNVTNHLKHKPGQAMEVDWSGSTMRLVDPVTGEVSKVRLFVAVLPYSQYTYVEATLDMKQNTWLLCHVNAYEFFGGVAVRLVCDNLKTGVAKHPKEGEVVLNEAYEALGRHYVCAIMPTGVAKPKQKASVEGGVGKIATAVIAKLRDREFATLAEMNAAIRERLDEYNARPFQKREGSRKLVFEEVEKPMLAPLPAVPFEVCDWVYGRKVNLDFHVVYNTNRYSAPYRLVGKKVDLKVTETTVEVYHGGERVATHPRIPDCVRYKPQTDRSHMPPEFADLEWDDGRMRRWASSIGPSALAVVERVFCDVQIKEQAYNPVMAILNLSKHYGDAELEAACAYSLEKTAHPRCKFIRSVLASGAARPADPGRRPADQGGYVRGASYYAGGAR
ncbi:MAG: IS21 family transposase [Atopobiaceae bacterium]|nr:IS21 family transposase [Atopobiaceae bacterium]